MTCICSKTFWLPWPSTELIEWIKRLPVKATQRNCKLFLLRSHSVSYYQVHTSRFLRHMPYMISSTTFKKDCNGLVEEHFTCQVVQNADLALLTWFRWWFSRSGAPLGSPAPSGSAAPTGSVAPPSRQTVENELGSIWQRDMPVCITLALAFRTRRVDERRNVDSKRFRHTSPFP